MDDGWSRWISKIIKSQQEGRKEVHALEVQSNPRQGPGLLLVIFPSSAHVFQILASLAWQLSAKVGKYGS